jgi:hydroxymethylglutaryl-CoA lyase
MPDTRPNDYIFASGRLPERVNLHEVGPREGLQSQGRVIDADVKVRFIEDLSETGVSRIECTGFFHPVKFPQLADADEVMRRVKRSDNIRYSSHIPNRTGLERALEAGVDSVIICLAASDETARREDDDCRSTDDCMTNKLQSLVKEARAADLWVRVFLTNAWGCPYEGPVPHDRVREICTALASYEVDEICLADNLAAATPADVDGLLQTLGDVVALERLAVHFHDNRGMAVSNVLVSIARGIQTVDVSAGGLGGHANCAYVPRGPAMVATEDVLFLLNGLGVETGVDLERVRASGQWIAEQLGVPVLGRYTVAGPVERVP